MHTDFIYKRSFHLQHMPAACFMFFSVSSGEDEEKGNKGQDKKVPLSSCRQQIFFFLQKRKKILHFFYSENMSQKPIFTKSMNSHKWVTTIHTQHSGQIWKTGLELWIASITLKKFDTIIYLPATCRRVKHQKTDDIYCSLLLKLAN